MSSNIGRYLRAQRRAWDLSQNDLAMLLPGGRKRVARIERGRALPNAEEILAYSLIFGLNLNDLLSPLIDETENSVMRGAYALSQKLDGQTDRRAARNRELTEQIRERLITGVDGREI